MRRYEKMAQKQRDEIKVGLVCCSACRDSNTFYTVFINEWLYLICVKCGEIRRAVKEKEHKP
jgi:hypothetical protein